MTYIYLLITVVLIIAIIPFRKSLLSLDKEYDAAEGMGTDFRFYNEAETEIFADINKLRSINQLFGLSISDRLSEEAYHMMPEEVNTTKDVLVTLEYDVSGKIYLTFIGDPYRLVDSLIEEEDMRLDRLMDEDYSRIGICSLNRYTQIILSE